MFGAESEPETWGGSQQREEPGQSPNVNVPKSGFTHALITYLQPDLEKHQAPIQN